MCAVRASSCSLISCTLPSSCERFTEKSIKSEELFCRQVHLIKKKYKSVAPHVVFFKERDKGLCDKPKW